MSLLSALIEASVRHRVLVLALTLLGVLGGALSMQRLTFDAFPDLTNTQVQVLTSSGGLGSEEVELLVTLPVERSLQGIPGIAELRSVSRPGVSSVTVVFEEGTDPNLARQWVKERVDLAREDIPPGLGSPELAPPTTGLGEVYQFTVASDSRSPSSLYGVFRADIAPRIQALDGVVEVNAWGGGEPQLDVVIDPWALAARGLTLPDVEAALQAAVGVESGGSLEAGSERASLRVIGNPDTPEALAELPLAPSVRLGDVAEIRDSGSLTVGLGTADGEGEVVFAVVQLLAGADARSVSREVQERVAEIQASLPDDVRIEPIYEREKLVGSTLHTVAKSLTEGGLLVILVLLLLLGDLRAGLVVASVIPMALLGAFVGLNTLGYSGNLMSLGAIDFGLVVDGTIVVVESIVALQLAANQSLREAVVQSTRSVARPVLFAVGILLLVYLPVLAMVGTEGRLFRPMAVTVLMALATALLLSFTYVPAISSFLVKPRGDHSTWLLAKARALHGPLLDAAMARPKVTIAVGALAITGTLALGTTLGVEFVPRLEEGDLAIQTARLPSISPAMAKAESTRIERIIQQFPEVERIASRTGSPALATDPMGMEEADILVRLRPMDQWETAADTEGLTAAFEAALRAGAPGPEYTFTQPIQMRFNELLEGITSDVGVSIYGSDLDALLLAGQQVAAALESVDGAADVVAPSLEGLAVVDLELQPERLARLDSDPVAARMMVAAVQRGVPVTQVIRGQYQDPVVLKIDAPKHVSLLDLPLATPAGVVSMGDVLSLSSGQRAAVVERDAGSRRVVVQANVRGRDLGSFMEEAQRAVDGVALPDGYWVSWSGEYEQLREASDRLALTLPLTLIAVMVMLYYAFASWRPAALILLAVPAAVSGGILALMGRGLPLSMSAIVGFIALSGIAVMNGIVLLSRTRELHRQTTSRKAALESARERFRPVLMTALVAGIGFVPMALAQGVGAEVQRPLATVVIGGLLTATPVTLLVLPSIYGLLFKGEDPA